MKKFLTFFFVSLIALNLLVKPTEAQAPTPSVASQELARRELAIKTPQGAITYYANLYGASSEELLNIANCESQYNQKAIGKEGEIGTFQYFPSTWKSMSKDMGQTLDINSFADQAKLTSWVYKNHPEYKTQWTTWVVWYGKDLKRCRV